MTRHPQKDETEWSLDYFLSGPSRLFGVCDSSRNWMTKICCAHSHRPPIGSARRYRRASLARRDPAFPPLRSRWPLSPRPCRSERLRAPRHRPAAPPPGPALASPRFAPAPASRARRRPRKAADPPPRRRHRPRDHEGREGGPRGGGLAARHRVRLHRGARGRRRHRRHGRAPAPRDPRHVPGVRRRPPRRHRRKARRPTPDDPPRASSPRDLSLARRGEETSPSRRGIQTRVACLEGGLVRCGGVSFRRDQQRRRFPGSSVSGDVSSSIVARADLSVSLASSSSLVPPFGRSEQVGHAPRRAAPRAGLRAPRRPGRLREPPPREHPPPAHRRELAQARGRGGHGHHGRPRAHRRHLLRQAQGLRRGRRRQQDRVQHDDLQRPRD